MKNLMRLLVVMFKDIQQWVFDLELNSDKYFKALDKHNKHTVLDETFISTCTFVNTVLSIEGSTCVQYSTFQMESANIC